MVETLHLHLEGSRKPHEGFKEDSTGQGQAHHLALDCDACSEEGEDHGQVPDGILVQRGGRVWTRLVVLVMEETWCPSGR